VREGLKAGMFCEKVSAPKKKKKKQKKILKIGFWLSWS
jgi:hypothetical protein